MTLEGRWGTRREVSPGRGFPEDWRLSRPAVATGRNHERADFLERDRQGRTGKEEGRR